MIAFELLRPEAKLPTKSTNGAAGYDLFATEQGVVMPGEITRVPLGLRSFFLPHVAALIWPRAGLALQGIDTRAGVIDSDYRGEWAAVLHNSSKTPFTFDAGVRVAQVVFTLLWTGEISQTTHIPAESDRSNSGFGSSGS